MDPFAISHLHYSILRLAVRGCHYRQICLSAYTCVLCCIIGNVYFIDTIVYIMCFNISGKNQTLFCFLVFFFLSFFLSFFPQFLYQAHRGVGIPHMDKGQNKPKIQGPLSKPTIYFLIVIIYLFFLMGIRFLSNIVYSSGIQKYFQRLFEPLILTFCGTSLKFEDNLPKGMPYIDLCTRSSAMRRKKWKKHFIFSSRLYIRNLSQFPYFFSCFKQVYVLRQAQRLLLRDRLLCRKVSTCKRYA